MRLDRHAEHAVVEPGRNPATVELLVDAHHVDAADERPRPGRKGVTCAVRVDEAQRTWSTGVPAGLPLAVLPGARLGLSFQGRTSGTDLVRHRDRGEDVRGGGPGRSWS